MLKLKKLLFLFAFIASSGVALAAESYQQLDRNIVKAYNSKPRKTSEVYIISRHILDKADKDESTTGLAWELKARKLITVSCYYECTRAIDRKLYRQAYVWAKRGTTKGTTFGKVGNTPLKKLYEYLNFAAKELAQTPMVKNSDPKRISVMIDNYKNLQSGIWIKSGTDIFAEMVVAVKLAEKRPGV